MKKLLPNSKGFTLVELLIVVSIIAVLSVIGVSIYSDVQGKARDAKRKADVDSIAKAYETHYVASAQTPYGVLDDSWFAGGGIPEDPINNDPYGYKYGEPDASGNLDATLTAPHDGGLGYIICAFLEKKNGNSSSTTGIAARGESATYYCRMSQQ